MALKSTNLSVIGIEIEAQLAQGVMFGIPLSQENG